MANKIKKTPRKMARSQAFQFLYGLNFSPAMTIESLLEAYIISPDNADKPEAQCKPEGFTWELIEGVWSNYRSLDEVIAKFSLRWKLERIGKIEITLLRLAIYEMLYREDIPPKVAINEAVELAKQFGDERSRTFVNGLLDAAAKAIEDGTLELKY